MEANNWSGLVNRIVLAFGDVFEGIISVIVTTSNNQPHTYTYASYIEWMGFDDN